MCFVLSELDEVLNKLTQGTSVQQHRVRETTDTSEENTEADQLQRRVRFTRTFKVKKSYAVEEMARFSPPVLPTI